MVFLILLFLQKQLPQSMVQGRKLYVACGLCNEKKIIKYNHIISLNVYKALLLLLSHFSRVRLCTTP